MSGRPAPSDLSGYPPLLCWQQGRGAVNWQSLPLERGFLLLDDPSSAAEVTTLNRLGHQFEQYALCQLLTGDGELHHSVKLFEDKRQLGEIDFCLLHADRPVTLECSFKLYLQTLPGRSLKAFTGPRTRDNFKKRFLKAVNRQLPLVHSAAFARHFRDHALFARENPVDFDSYFVCHGMLFYPLERKNADFRPGSLLKHPVVNPPWLVERDSARGWWAHHPITLDQSCRYSILQYTDWIFPFEQPQLGARETAERLAAHFAESIRARMLQVHTPEGIRRLLVVHPDWPGGIP